LDLSPRVGGSFGMFLKDFSGRFLEFVGHLNAARLTLPSTAAHASSNEAPVQKRYKPVTPVQLIARGYFSRT